MELKKRANGKVDFLAGLCAGVGNVLVCAPLDTARTRLQVQGLYTPRYSGIIQTLGQFLNPRVFVDFTRA